MVEGDVLGGVDDIDRGRRWLRRDAKRAGRVGADVDGRANSRLTRLVEHARTSSPLFAELYDDVDSRAGVEALPVTTKSMLLERFDEWCTDREITRGVVEDFVADDENIGTRLLNKYLFSESSGTSGVTGMFVTEDSALAVAGALGVRNRRLTPAGLLRLMSKRARTAVIINTRGHHMGAAFYASRTTSGPDPRVRMMSVFDPIDDLVAQLAECDPGCVSSYASVMVLLAREQLAGRLAIDPVAVLPFSETITPASLQLMQRAWPHAQIIDRYVANECMFISARCAHGWHHLNADWVILEPVDADRNPVPPGTWSHTVLLTTLFRRVQPIIRYELGDSIMMRPDGCTCGNPLPAFDVAGRSGELLYFGGGDHRRAISPTVMTVVLDDIPGLTLWQAARDSPTHLSVRMRVAADHDPARVGDAVRRELTALFADTGHPVVTIDISDRAPTRTPGGKFLRVIDDRPRVQ